MFKINEMKLKGYCHASNGRRHINMIVVYSCFILQIPTFVGRTCCSFVLVFRISKIIKQRYVNHDAFCSFHLYATPSYNLDELY